MPRPLVGPAFVLLSFDSCSCCMPQKASSVYELRSINLANLPENEQARVVDQFASFLNSLAHPVTFDVVKDVRRVAALGASYEVPYMRFFVTSGSQIDDLLVGLLGTNKFERVPAAPSIEVSHVSSRYVMGAQSQFVQTFNVTRLGGAMETAFLTRVYGTAHSVRLHLLPVEPYQARALSAGMASGSRRRSERTGLSAGSLAQTFSLKERKSTVRWPKGSMGIQALTGFNGDQHLVAC
jgi:hypothetical protein